MDAAEPAVEGALAARVPELEPEQCPVRTARRDGGRPLHPRQPVGQVGVGEVRKDGPAEIADVIGEGQCLFALHHLDADLVTHLPTSRPYRTMPDMMVPLDTYRSAPSRVATAQR